MSGEPIGWDTSGILRFPDEPPAEIVEPYTPEGVARRVGPPRPPREEVPVRAARRLSQRQVRNAAILRRATSSAATVEELACEYRVTVGLVLRVLREARSA